MLLNTDNGSPMAQVGIAHQIIVLIPLVILFQNISLFFFLKVGNTSARLLKEEKGHARKVLQVS